MTAIVPVQAQVTFAGSQVGLAAGTWSAPVGAATDGKGNIFIADRGTNSIVELSPAGTSFSAPVTILTGLSGPSGIAADSNGNVFVSDTGNNRILMLPFVQGAFAVPVTVASGFNAPNGIALDTADNLYVADSGNNRVVELPLLGSVYAAPVAVSLGLNNPMGVAVDGSRNLFIADTGNQRIVKQLYVAGGYAAQQSFWSAQMTPVGISVDKSDDLFISDSANARVLEEPWFAAANRFSNAIVIGTGFVSPAGVVTDANRNVYVADSARAQVVEVSTGSINFNAVNIGSSAADVTYNFSIAPGVTLGGTNIYTQGARGQDFADAGGSTCIAKAYSTLTYCGVNVEFTPLISGTRRGAVVLADANGNPLATAFISGVGKGPQVAVYPGTVTTLGVQLSAPAGVAVDGSGNLYIADSGNNRIVEIPRVGNGYGSQIPLTQNGLINPMGLAVDGAGNLYVASNGNDKVAKLPWMGTGFGQPVKISLALSGPSSVAVDPGGDLYISDTLDARIDELSWTGTSYSTVQQVGSYHKAPTGVAVDGTGEVYFTDPYQSQISEIVCCGITYAVQNDMNTVKTSFPSAIAVDGNSNLYILDTGNNRVIMLPWSGSSYGKQITIATGFNAPGAIAIDGNDRIFVADTGNNQIVEIDMSIPSQMNFANSYLGSTSPDGEHLGQVENVGNEPMDINSVSYPPDFPEAAGVNSPCEEVGAIGQGQSCQISANFTPQAAGNPLTESIVVVGSFLGSAATELTFPMTGTALGKQAQTITFPSLPGMTYGTPPLALSASASSGLPITYTIVSGPAVLQNGGKVLRITGAGTVVIAAAQAGNSTYWAANAIEISCIVAPATLTVTPASTAVYYGAVPVSFGYTISGFVNGDYAAVATTGRPVITSNATTTSPAGTYVLTASQGGLAAANYTFAFAQSTLIVGKARLYVAANNVIRNYGFPMKNLTWYLAGFVNGDNAGVVAGAPTLTTPANSGSPVGTYPILVSPGTLTATNYFFVGANGTVTVNPAPILVTPASQTMVYGSQVPQLTYWLSGLLNGDLADVVHGSPIIATNATQKSSVGTYTITSQLGTLAAANYTFKLSTGVLKINKAPLIAVPANASMTYGDKLPSFSYKLTGFVGADTAVASVSGSPVFNTAANPTSRPGVYAVLIGTGTLTSSNYYFSFGTGALTIGKATITITPSQVSKNYGAPLPALTYRGSGFLNGDGGSTIQGVPSLSTPATAASPVGNYPVTCAVGSLTSSSYNFNCVSGTLTVNKAVIAVKGASLAMTYGGALPALTYQMSGFVNGDSANSISGVPLLSTVATARSAVGAYPVTVSMGSLVSANYAFVLSNGTIAVQKALLKVNASSQAMTYGAALPALTYTVTGFLNGDSQNTAITGAPQISTIATHASASGRYAITPALGSLAAANYTFAFVPGWLTVNQATLTVSANNVTMQVGGVVPALTYSTTGWVNGDTQVALTGAPVLTTNATSTSAAGSYAIVVMPGTMKSANYQLVCVNGTLIASQSSATLHRALPR